MTFIWIKTISAMMEVRDVVTMCVAHIVVRRQFFGMAIVDMGEAFVVWSVFCGDSGANGFSSTAAATATAYAVTLSSASTTTAAAASTVVGNLALKRSDKSLHADVFGLNGARGRCSGDGGRDAVIVTRTHRFHDADEFVNLLALFDGGGPEVLEFGVVLHAMRDAAVVLALGGHVSVAG